MPYNGIMLQMPPKRDDDVRPDELVRVIKREPKDEALEKVHEEPRTPLPKGILWGIFGLVVLFIGGSLVSFLVIRGEMAVSVSKDFGLLRTGVSDLQGLDLSAAQKAFSSIGSLSNLSAQLVFFSQEMGDVASSSFDFFVTGAGGPLIADLGRLRDTLGAINAESDQLSSVASFAGNLSPAGVGDFYLSLKSQIKSAENFLDAFVPWLADPGTHHLLVLLENPSEIRPAGGFLGSYADVTLASGTITDIAVHDIADADTAFNRKIVPPKPLQLEITKWRPADANWFFDFPTSASKTTAFFEESDLYAKTSTTFDGVVAITPRVINDLLSIVGPVAIGKPTTTFAADNFLVQIQKIVQSGQATSATYPKQVLRDLSRALFAKLASTTSDERQALLAMALDWAAKKEIMVYFKDQAMEDLLGAYGASGAVYEFPQRFNGDYLALVDANVNGGKSDLYVSSTLSYTGRINPDGTMTSHVVVTRRHNGAKSPYWWYKTTNQDYAQVFVPPGTTLTNASGTVQKKIVPPINYAKSGYSTDPLVSSVESTEQTLFAYPGVAWHEESGARVFTTWSTVKAGASTQFSLDYTHRLFLPPAAGVQYQFVFEKQAGTKRHYSYEIDAPLGYVFAENGIASYAYESDDPPGRLVVNLTLQSL